MPKAAKKSIMTLDQLKKEDYLLIFMLNHEDSTSTPFKLSYDGCDFIHFKGTKDYRSLQSMLQALKRKEYVVNISYGNWSLTPAGIIEAEYWLSKCGCRRVKEIAATTKSAESLEKKLAHLEAELDRLRCEIAMANDTNQYLDEKNTKLQKENMKLKKKLEMLQRVLNGRF